MLLLFPLCAVIVFHHWTVSISSAVIRIIQSSNNSACLSWGHSVVRVKVICCIVQASVYHNITTAGAIPLDWKNLITTCKSEI